MKKFAAYLLLICSIFLYSQEYIERFHADLAVDSSGLLTVTESITIISEANQFKRGIYRALPLSRKDSLGNSIDVNYQFISALKDGEPVPYSTQKSGDRLSIYVGDENVFLTPGKYTYTLTYTTPGQVGFMDTYDEIYWNINGDKWNFRIEEISAEVSIEGNPSFLSNACYTGYFGESGTDCTYTTLENGNIYFEAKNLKPGENLTVASAFPKGFVAPPPPPPPPTFIEKYGIPILTFLGMILLAIYYFFTWKKHGIDPEKPTVYPQYNPPHDLSPASIGMLKKERYWSDLITSTMVNLAVKKYIRIEEKSNSQIFGLFKSKSFEIHKLKDADEHLPLEEKHLLTEMFKENNVLVLDGEYNETMKEATEGFKMDLELQHSDLINQGNNYKFLVFPVLFIILVVVLAFAIANGSHVSILNFFSGAISFIPILLFYTFFNIFIRKKINVKLLILIFVGVYIALLGWIIWQHFNLNNAMLLGFITFSTISFVIYQYLIKKPAVEKLEKQSLIEGFEMYLGAAEEKQLQHFNPPNLTPEIFEQMLPYAIALGVEEIWGEKFQNLINQSMAGAADYQPTWYYGGPIHYATFGHSLNSSLSNTLSKSSTPPSSSSSGGGSWGGGSFGGGFSGGGGGGGGGGGW